MAEASAKKISLLPDRRIIQQITGAVSLLSLATLLLFFFLLPVPISTVGLSIIGVASVGFFALYFVLPKLYFHETMLMVGDALYITLITYIASYLGEYGVFILFLYFVIIIADALKYPLSEYIIVVLFTVQAAFFYIMLGTPFEFNVRLGILALFSFSTLATAIFIWYFASQIVNERSLRSLMEKKSLYLKAMNDHLKAIDNMRQNIMQVTSHEFRTPLTRIKYSLEQLRDTKICDLKPDQLQLLQVAATSNSQLIGMINDLMAASSLPTTKSQLRLQKVDMVGLVRVLIDEYKDIIASREQKLVVNLPSGVLQANIDPAVIRIAYKNLLDNATQYTPAGGTITASVEVGDKDVLLSIQDTGIGIPQADMPHIFSQFYRTDNAILKKPDGFGIGLYFSRQIVRYHKGDITVTSKEGEGSTFTIRLPATALVTKN